MHLDFVSSLNTWMAQAVEIFSCGHGKQGPNTCINMNHGCWRPDDSRTQGISRYGTNVCLWQGIHKVCRNHMINTLDLTLWPLVTNSTKPLPESMLTQFYYHHMASPGHNELKHPNVLSRGQLIISRVLSSSTAWLSSSLSTHDYFDGY